VRRALAALVAGTLRRGPLWPAGLAIRLLRLRTAGLQRGLMVEPSTKCLAGCRSCKPSPPRDLAPSELEAWLACRPVPPATIGLAGRHSDPLASGFLASLVDISRRYAYSVTISTSGAGLTERHAVLPVDRWVFGIPGATRGSYEAVRGVDGFDGVIAAIRMVRSSSPAMTEVALTVWKPSASDREPFVELARREGWRDIQVVPGIFDPTGHDVGRPEMLATGSPDCPYALDGCGEVRLSRPSGQCPATGYTLIDACSVLRPCPFAGEGDPSESVPSREAWVRASRWESLKHGRKLGFCRWCP
jgi:hypothetical protein